MMRRRNISLTLQEMKALHCLTTIVSSVFSTTVLWVTPATATTCIETPAQITKCWDNKGGSSMTIQTSPGVQTTWGTTTTGRSYKDTVIPTSPNGYSVNFQAPMSTPMPLTLGESMLNWQRK